jgi:hypothetical protein
MVHHRHKTIATDSGCVQTPSSNHCGLIGLKNGRFVKRVPIGVLIVAMVCPAIIVLAAPLENDKVADDAKNGRTQFEQEQRKRLAKVEPEFGKVYFLNENEVLRHIPEPLNEDLRNQWMRALFGTPAGANRPDTTVLFLKWEDGRAQWNGASMGGPVRTGVEFRTVLTMLKIGSTQSVDGEEALLRHAITGDWVVDPKAPVEKLVAALEPILRKQWEIPVTLRFRDDERDVYVVSGEWEFEAISKEYPEVQIYGKHLDKNSGAGGGTGAFAEFLDHVGSWIKLPLLAPRLVES